jgi:hypothetical protein
LFVSAIVIDETILSQAALFLLFLAHCSSRRRQLVFVSD